MNRNLDGCYFRVKRDGQWESICFSDLTDDERCSICDGKDAVWLRSLAYHLADCLKDIGEFYNIDCKEE